jgi:hypothetical protein
MKPRRLLPYLLVFLALAGLYLGLQWRQGSREAKEQQAKKVFQVQEDEISDLALIKGQEEIHLVKKGKEWFLDKPIKAKADAQMVSSMLTALAHLEKERDLGAAEGLQPFGLDKPTLVVAFTAQGKPQRLIFGNKAPGDRSYYARKDEARQILLVRAVEKDTLDRQLSGIRDKTLFSFTLDKVKGLKFTMGALVVQLAKAGPETWRWLGREGFQVRGDRAETMLRTLDNVRVKEFVADAPKDVSVFGLAPKPQAEVEVTLEPGREALLLGNKTAKGIYARKGTEGPVVLLDPELLAQLTRMASSLEDRRLWAGPLPEVDKVVWGPPEKLWTAVKTKDFWKITGPEGRELKQPAVRLEAALWTLTQLEYEALKPPGEAPGKGGYALQIYGDQGKQLFSLEELDRKAKTEVEVRTLIKGKPTIAVLAQKKYADWQGAMERLISAPEKK